MVETLLVFALIPLAIYGVIGLATMRSKFAGTPRYRPGQEWEHPPLWWSANPDGVGGSRSHAAVEANAGTATSTARGGARGNW